MFGKVGKNHDELTDYGYDHKINICMIGPRGVGKTSLLATMYNMVQRNLGGNLRFEPLSKDIFSILNEKYINLQEIVDKPPYTRVIDNQGGTQEIREYLFGLDLVDNSGRRKKNHYGEIFRYPRRHDREDERGT